MANEIDNETTQTSLRIEVAVLDAVEKLASEESRTKTNTIVWLLKTHPRIQPILEAQTAEVSA